VRASTSKRKRKTRAKERNHLKDEELTTLLRDHPLPPQRRRLVGIRGRNLEVKFNFDPETEMPYDLDDPVRAADGVVAELADLSERRERQDQHD